MSDNSDAACSQNDDLKELKLDLFKHYEGAAADAKAHAWTQTAWILTLNTGLLVFSLDMYLEHKRNPSFLVIELMAAGAGILLCAYLYQVLNELGIHIRNYWKIADTVRDDFPEIWQYVSIIIPNGEGKPDEESETDMPRFCSRLWNMARLFLIAHIIWAVFVVYPVAWALYVAFK